MKKWRRVESFGKMTDGRFNLFQQKSATSNKCPDEF